MCKRQKGSKADWQKGTDDDGAERQNCRMGWMSVGPFLPRCLSALLPYTNGCSVIRMLPPPASVSM